TARDKLQIWSTGQITGEVQTDRLAIEDGALLRGKVEAGKQITKPAETKAAAATATSKAAPQSTGVNSGTAADYTMSFMHKLGSGIATGGGTSGEIGRPYHRNARY